MKDSTSTAGNTAYDLNLFAAHRTFVVESEQTVIEAILSGDAYTLANGNIVSVAAGLQYRDFAYRDIADSLSFFRLDGRADPVFSIANASQECVCDFCRGYCSD